MRTDFVRNIKAYRNILCFLTVIAVLGSFAPVFAESVVYNGFAGQYQHIYVNGLMLRAADGKIIADNQTVTDKSDQFLPRDMGDGSYAFEVRSSNLPHLEEIYGWVYDEDTDEEVWEKTTVEVYNDFTQRIAAASAGSLIPMTRYEFGHKDIQTDALFSGLNDNTQHWIRERSEDYTEGTPSYYLKSLYNDLYIGLSGDGASVIATDADHRAKITFEALSGESPLHLLSQTDAYAQLSAAQRARIERVYESVAGDVFEKHGFVMAENESLRGRLDKIYNETKYSPSALKQRLLNYVSQGSAWVTEHNSSSYHVSMNLPDTNGFTVICTGETDQTGHPSWYAWPSQTDKTKKFKARTIVIAREDGTDSHMMEVWYQADESFCEDDANRFQAIISKIPYIYRKGIKTFLIENYDNKTNSFYSNGPYLFLRANHPTGEQGILDTIIHEMGHSLDTVRRNNGQPNAANEWDLARANDIFSPSSYGASPSVSYIAEDFAEFCRFYFTCYQNKDWQRALQILFPNRYAILAGVRERYLDGFELWKDGIVVPDGVNPEPTVTPPKSTPTPSPTPTPTAKPTATPTVQPTPTPTITPTATPTVEPTATPTVQPTPTPTPSPTAKPTPIPTVKPTPIPTVKPTVMPTTVPTVEPTATPTAVPTVAPTDEPTITPTITPSVKPTVMPTETPAVEPTVSPTPEPTTAPTTVPTPEPTEAPVVEPTMSPSPEPTAAPTVAPAEDPTIAPTIKPSVKPTVMPTETPAVEPTMSPTLEPTTAPTIAPTPYRYPYRVIKCTFDTQHGYTEVLADCLERKDNAVMIFAVYDDNGALESVHVKEISQSGGLSEEFPCGGGEFKVFIWDKITQEPYSEVFMSE